MNLAGVGAGQVYTDDEIVHISKWCKSNSMVEVLLLLCGGRSIH